MNRLERSQYAESRHRVFWFCIVPFLAGWSFRHWVGWLRRIYEALGL